MTLEKYVLCTICILSFTFCSKPVRTAVISEPVRFVSEVAQKSILVTAEGVGTNAVEAIRDAEITVIRNLLYVGIPNSQQYRPWVAEGKAIEDSKSTFFTPFFQQNQYKDFIISSKCVENGGKGSRVFLVDIEINTFSLRAHLERNNIIRKFGL